MTKRQAGTHSKKEVQPTVAGFTANPWRQQKNVEIWKPLGPWLSKLNSGPDSLCKLGDTTSLLSDPVVFMGEPKRQGRTPGPLVSCLVMTMEK